MSESEQQYSSESKYSFEGRSRANAIVDSPSSHGSRTTDATELDFDTLSISGASSRDSRQVDFNGCSTDGISADAKDYPRESHARHTRRNSCPDLGTLVEKSEKRKSASFRKKSFAGLKVDMNVALKGTDELAVGLHSVTGRITEPRELPISKDGVRSRRHSTTGVSPLRVVVESKESKEEGKAREQDAEIMSEYEMTANGEFNIQGFSISKYGIMRTPRGKHNHYAHHDELEGATMSDALVKVRVLGKGSSGTVTKMLHIPTLKLVAVKAIACFEQSKRAEVLHELQTLNQNAVPIDEEEEVEEEKDGRIHCDNIVSFYNAFINRSRDSVSFVEEYMDGGTLQSVVDSGGCTCEETLSTIAQGLLKGLAFLHGRGQIHRDVKPSNILVNRHGDVKISDFGISVRPARGQLCTSFVGTLMFMSPERILSKEYSFNADIWGLGVTMAAIALGKLPFECDPGYWGLVRRVGEGPRIRLPRDGALSDMFCDFVELCLEKDPLERPSAKELLEHEFVSFSHMNHTKVANLFPMAKRPSTAEQQAAINPVVSAFVKYHQLTLSANQKYKESGERAPTKIPQVPQEQLDQLAEQLQCDVDLVSSTMSNAINRANSMNMVSASARSPLHKHNPRRRRHQDSPVGVHTASAV